MRSWLDYKKTMRSESVVFSFARAGDVEAIEVLDLPPEILDEKDVNGYSTLMLAAYHGHEDLTRFLLTRGADPNTRDNAGNTVLMGAAFKGYLTITKLLLEGGADPTLKNPKGLDALAFAEMFGRNEIAAYLRQQPYEAELAAARDFS